MKTLGLDIGSNSIAWAITDLDDDQSPILDCGVYRFLEGVKIEKGAESSLAEERTKFRAARRLKFRRKLRKYHTLKVLIENNLCPLNITELKEWVSYSKLHGQKYPTSPEFRNWLASSEKINPYLLRYKAVHGKITPYELGRVLYHLAQRRGFKSNRKDATADSKDTGTVKEAIAKITTEKGNKTLGEYFYEQIQNGCRVRNRYTARDAHYIEEFNKICEIQQVNSELQKKLYKALFFQRPLRSQKHTVGKCTLEKTKSRAPISHYYFEEYRALQLINNIRIKKVDDEKSEFAALTLEQKNYLRSIFLSKKTNFQIADIMKFLFKKEAARYYCNYRFDTSIPSSPISAGFFDIFGENWQEITVEKYSVEDIWHNLFFFDDTEKLKNFAKEKLFLDDEKAHSFCKIALKQGYASYSLKAIKAILPFLREGYQLAQAIFLAKIPEIVGVEHWKNYSEEIKNTVKKLCDAIPQEKIKYSVANGALLKLLKQPLARVKDHVEQDDFPLIVEVITDILPEKTWNAFTEQEQNTQIQEIAALINSTKKLEINRGELFTMPTAIDHITEVIAKITGKEKTAIREDLYHPAENEWYNDAKIIEGKKFLPSPELPALKNPLVMRSMYSIKKLVNQLLKDNKVDESTAINIELANEINSKNKRAAIEWYQRDREKENAGYAAEIARCLKEANSEREITATDIKKFRLWKEQGEMCLYTNKKINFCQLLNDNSAFDIEHTIPRSFSYDDSLENLTLCDCAFNRDVKKAMIPFQLANYEQIKQNAERFYFEKAETFFAKAAQAAKSSKIAHTKEEKDTAIQRKERNLLEAFYYKNKFERFIMEEVKQGFSHSQLIDTRIITKYAKYYLKTVFDSVLTINGNLTAEFRKLWGLQNSAKKDRTSHIHHAIDAIVVACMTRANRDKLAMEIRNMRLHGHCKFSKPWETFTEDVLHKTEAIIVAHQSKNKVFSASKHVIFSKGKKYVSGGDTVRGSLHQETIYGAIQHKNARGLFERKYVVRKPISALEKIDHIVDSAIKREAEKVGSTKLKAGEKLFITTKKGTKVEVKKVRTIATTVTRPILLKPLSHVSAKEYKRFQYVQNDYNYAMVIYQEKNAKGKIESDFELANILTAKKALKNKTPLFPQTKEKAQTILTQKYFLQNGMNVLLLETEEENIFNLCNTELLKRMYTITGLSSMTIQGKYVYGVVTVRYNHEARQSTELKVESGVFSKNEKPKPLRKFQHSQFHALMQGVDFTLLPTGQILWIEKNA